MVEMLMCAAEIGWLYLTKGVIPRAKDSRHTSHVANAC